MEQTVIWADDTYSSITKILKDKKLKKIFLVAGGSFEKLRISQYFNEISHELNLQIVIFSDFSSNPLYESVEKGIKQFNNFDFDAIFAIGGGSAIDVAKCIKLYSNASPDKPFFEQDIVPCKIPFIVMPTTAGTGSEATRFAVIYYKGAKQSVSDYSCIPDTVIFDTSTLDSLPQYHRKSAMLDALCHAIESFWSINSTEESKNYSKEAIILLLQNMDDYLANKKEANKNMFKAATYAGKAINITQTTAGHAMCYKMTSLYGIAHGHAVAICVEKLWGYMVENIDKCIDQRGQKYLTDMFSELDEIFDCKNQEHAYQKFSAIIKTCSFDKIYKDDVNSIELLADSVNPVRLKNNPIKMTKNDFEYLYGKIITDK